MQPYLHLWRTHAFPWRLTLKHPLSRLQGQRHSGNWGVWSRLIWRLVSFKGWISTGFYQLTNTRYFTGINITSKRTKKERDRQTHRQKLRQRQGQKQRERNREKDWKMKNTAIVTTTVLSLSLPLPQWLPHSYSHWNCPTVTVTETASLLLSVKLPRC